MARNHFSGFRSVPVLLAMFKEAGHAMPNGDPFLCSDATVLINVVDFITACKTTEYLKERVT